MIKKLGFILCMVILFMAMSFESDAKINHRYITKKVALNEMPKKKSANLDRLMVNNRVILIKEGKKWSRIKFKSQIGYVRTNVLHQVKSPKKYTKKSFKRRGRIKWHGCSFTWYTTKRHPDRKNYLGIKGKHFDKQGFVCDKDGYICLASSISNKKKKLIVPTPFGKYGKVYDTNGKGSSNWRDVYTNW